MRNEPYRVATPKHREPFPCYGTGNDGDKGTSVDGSRKRELYVGGRQRFRYIRYCSKETCDTPIAEVEFWSGGHKVKAVPGKSTVKKVELSVDDNTLTRPDIAPGYILGYELEKPEVLDSIVFYPWNDDNFVLPTHEYELFYYDKGWVSLGKRKPETYALVYEVVPAHALLLLKDQTKGNEERPFTYENKEQVWW